MAFVFVDGSLVGTWYNAGQNLFHRWRDNEFMIPAAFTNGKSRMVIRVVSASSYVDWNEFSYTTYAFLPKIISLYYLYLPLIQR